MHRTRKPRPCRPGTACEQGSRPSEQRRTRRSSRARLLHPEGRSSFQDLALDLQLRDPAAQRSVLPGLCGLGLEPARIGSLPALLVLLQPVAEIRLPDTQLMGDRGDRPARRSHQRDRVSLEFRRELPALLSHRDSLRQAQPGRSGVRHTGGGSDSLRRRRPLSNEFTDTAGTVRTVVQVGGSIQHLTINVLGLPFQVRRTTRLRSGVKIVAITVAFTVAEWILWLIHGHSSPGTGRAIVLALMIALTPLVSIPLTLAYRGWELASGRYDTALPERMTRATQALASALREELNSEQR